MDKINGGGNFTKWKHFREMGTKEPQWVSMRGTTLCLHGCANHYKVRTTLVLWSVVADNRQDGAPPAWHCVSLHNGTPLLLALASHLCSLDYPASLDLSARPACLSIQ